MTARVLPRSAVIEGVWPGVTLAFHPVSAVEVPRYRVVAKAVRL